MLNTFAGKVPVVRSLEGQLHLMVSQQVNFAGGEQYDQDNVHNPVHTLHCHILLSHSHWQESPGTIFEIKTH